MDFSNLPAFPVAANNPMYSPNSDAFPSPDEIDAYLTESYPALSDYGFNTYDSRSGQCFNRSITPGARDVNWSAPVPNSYVSTPSFVSATSAGGEAPLNAWPNYSSTPLSCPADFQHAYTATDFPNGYPSNPSPLPTPPTGHGSPISLSPTAHHGISPEDTSLKPPAPRKRGRPRIHRPASEPTATTTAKIARTQCMPHTEVERKYREKLNAELERLRRAVPMLPQSDATDTGAVKPSKSMVLAVAIDYIKELERQRDAAVEEVERLGGKMRFGRAGVRKREDGDA
ncbi:hypothetical protein J4E83_003498 [Alternaria metachromatica]|uniref:uncharacterized protein n=1 Tax=Alternaria metachromatica TaxID=283354 RepID=UPI0020C3BBFA|nr:uncharacterized protein J4E83_003498 [Alternaria metachromatica]KAI4628945.1 hypothetical protein J4E83_003498 [Alternaria metachromatica]